MKIIAETDYFLIEENEVGEIYLTNRRTIGRPNQYGNWVKIVETGTQITVISHENHDFVIPNKK
jgi:hypothetical protein